MCQDFSSVTDMLYCTPLIHFFYRLEEPNPTFYKIISGHLKAKAQLKVIFEQLEGKAKLFMNLDSKVLGLCVMDDIEREIEESKTVTAKVIKLVDAATSTPVTGGSTGHPALVMPTVVDRTMKPKLPKLSLAKFRGDVTSWSAFWDSYRPAVHENHSKAVVDTLIHSLLEGLAARTSKAIMSQPSSCCRIDLVNLSR